MDALINDTVEFLEASLSNKNIRIDSSTDKKLNVFSDENLLKTVMRNVLANDIKIFNKGSKIYIISKKNGKTIELIIKDYGVEMNSKVLDSLFHLDKNFSEQGTGGEEGIGLCLILCEELLSLSNGKIRIESELGKGTSVHVLLVTN